MNTSEKNTIDNFDAERRLFLQRALAFGGALAFTSTNLMALQAEQETNPAIRRVLVIFKCHFDAGFANTQANIIREYFDIYFPRAIQVAKEMRASGEDRYVWTTGSWLLYQYLQEASPALRQQMDEAVHRGDIAWHALPFTWQTEFMDPTLIQGALGLSKSLDQRYGRTTIGAKLTDVPGHSRGLIRPLVQGGVTFLDVGANELCTRPQVPLLCTWKNASGDSIILMYHQGYGGTVVVPGSDLAVAISMRGDNSGPHTPDEIRSIYAQLRRRFPNAQIKATDLTEIAHAVEPYGHQLPVITSEMGDTWIHGVSSDPVKTARYREFTRLRRKWIMEGKLVPGQGVDLAMLPSLLLAPEHTWGADTKLYLDYDHYTPAQLAQVLDTKPYRTMAFSWEEKRNDLRDAIAALPVNLRREAEERMNMLAVIEPTTAGLMEHTAGEEIDTRHYSLIIDPHTGSICRLRNKKTNRDWASSERPLALFVYQTLSQDDYQRFATSYALHYDTHPEILQDLGKPKMTALGPESREWMPHVERCWSGKEEALHRVLVQLKFLESPLQKAGITAWPEKLYLEIVLPDRDPIVQLNFYWFNKAPQRLPESMWLSFLPVAPEEQAWMLTKVDEPVSPFDVVPGGNRHMHAISDTIRYQTQQEELSISSMDAPLLALGKRTPLYFSYEQPRVKEGIHFNLYNNVFGTNYILWFSEAMRFRFEIR
jgi:hypothetical protein